MHERLIEMTAGQTVRVGDYWVTLLDVDGDQLCLQIESDEDQNCDNSFDGKPEYLQFA